MYKKHVRRHVNRTKKIRSLSNVIKRVLCRKGRNGKYRRLFLKEPRFNDILRGWDCQFSKKQKTFIKARYSGNARFLLSKC